ncbi:MAG: hypothetical protein IJV64_00725, partial [Oscillospiraceae bacterium]|nr:hypothetical protein [Oscillospiraceae bacterium]
TMSEMLSSQFINNTTETSFPVVLFYLLGNVNAESSIFGKGSIGNSICGCPASSAGRCFGSSIIGVSFCVFAFAGTER